ncbi:hypothetical protein [Anaerosporobacter faecicola]|uniref:hypothetical protein n=1 Tax=Anaerosporobacter faecicola TaxID=2718714 RepID=UPI001439852E|nr:hypothetical protein [Anaerosporobacter faecicola]
MSEFKIINPPNIKLSDIKVDVIQTDDCIITTNTYPNGFVLKMIQKADEVKIQTSSPMINNNDGTFSIPE